MQNNGEISDSNHFNNLADWLEKEMDPEYGIIDGGGDIQVSFFF